MIILITILSANAIIYFGARWFFDMIAFIINFKELSATKNTDTIMLFGSLGFMLMMSGIFYLARAIFVLL